MKNLITVSLRLFILAMFVTSLNGIAQQTITPMTLVSSGKMFYVSTGDKNALCDRNLSTNWEGADNSWIAVDIGAGPSKLLLHWIAEERADWIPYWETPTSTGSLGAYEILVSDNSTNGQDGTWTSVVSVTGNIYVGRMHSFDFTNKRWVKLKITGRTYSNDPIGLAELEIFDASNGTNDTWFFMGNSITAGAFHNRITPSFSQVASNLYPGYIPAMINGGHSGSVATYGVSQIDEYLKVNTDIRNWCLEYGTNDSRDGVDTTSFHQSLETIITKVTAAGHTVLLAHVPWSLGYGPLIPQYNKIIDNLIAKYNLTPGPDLFTWFQNHPTEMKPGGDVHPNDVGSTSMNRLWAQEVGTLHPTTANIVLSSPSVSPDSVADNGQATLTFSLNATAQGSITGVSMDLRAIGGSAAYPLTHTSGNMYTSTFTMPATVAQGTKTLVFTVTDNNGHTMNAVATLIVTDHNASVLVSRKKTVVASSTQDASVPASNVVDGDFFTRWASAAGDPQWIYIDLGTAMMVNRVTLDWETAYASGYKIQVSTDATNWTDVFTTTIGNGGSDTISFSQVSARYVRMYGTTRGTPYAYSLYEFQVFAPPQPTITRGLLNSNRIVTREYTRIMVMVRNSGPKGLGTMYDIRGKKVDIKDLSIQTVVFKTR